MGTTSKFTKRNYTLVFMVHPTLNSYNRSMDWRYRLLRIDSQAGITVGIAALLLSNWLDEWYQLPQSFIYFLALANITYGCYSFSLLVRRKTTQNPHNATGRGKSNMDCALFALDNYL